MSDERGGNPWAKTGYPRAEALKEGNPAKDAPPCRLGVNIDHVATIRNARGGSHPDPVRAAKLAQACGADGITAHLREDRRHIRDDDMQRLKDEVGLPLNFEMAATPEMVEIAVRTEPHAACLVPERRMERTTEGGLDLVASRAYLEPAIERLKDAGIRVSLFIDPEEDQIRTAADLGAPVIELHTGTYAEAALATDKKALTESFDALRKGAELAHELGIEVHAGHGLTFWNVQNIAALPQVRELNIGHFLIGEAVFMGLDGAIKEMKRLIADARTGMLL
ncbi:pyridoxine 5'-phosphate synthase [Parvularcula lutaonensis]|uniref:Pyridoxine 5'-phosphate synthase n=1 Tax=Parvularcula lutaonensis TaxID=491923 RepID=A0ABV7MFC1_9PROT|nr:pyridoxine 5'-phosphate synthase [Parvularcula lutaonensis]GGY52599.1 pyridoxine 5'-phosphate synthase [Parvularcula lutaonensis]